MQTQFQFRIKHTTVARHFKRSKYMILFSKMGQFSKKNLLLIRLIEIAFVKCDLLQDAVSCRQVWRLDPKPYKSHPIWTPRTPRTPSLTSPTLLSLPGPSVIQRENQFVNVSLLSALQNKTTRKQTQLSDNRGGDLGWTPRREFYLFPYFSVIPRLCVRLSSGNFKDLNGAISTIIVICGL